MNALIVMWIYQDCHVDLPGSTQEERLGEASTSLHCSVKELMKSEAACDPANEQAEGRRSAHIVELTTSQLGRRGKPRQLESKLRGIERS